MRLTTRALLAVGAVLATALVAVPAHADPLTATTTTVTGPASSVSGSSVTFTATVAEATPADPVVVPTGTVSFSTGAGEPVAVALVDGVATYAVSGLAVGSWTITATYVPDAGHAGSSGSFEHTVAAPPIPPAPTTPTPTSPTSSTPAKPPKAPKPVKKPTVTLAASRTDVSVGDKVTLRWTSKNADTARASGDWKGAQKAKGSATVRITERGTHRFKMTVRNASGKASAKVVVTAIRKAKELELVVTDEPVLPGAKVALAADGLAPGEKYTVRMDGKSVLTGTADKKGDVKRDLVLPQVVADGEHVLAVTGSNPGRVGKDVLTVIGPKDLEVEVASAQLGPGMDQTLTVEGLMPGEEVTVTLDGKDLTKGKADDAGVFTHEFAVGKKRGVRTVEVLGALPTRNGEANFEVQVEYGPSVRASVAG